MSEIFEVEPEYGNSVGRVNLTAYSGSKWREVELDTITRALSIIEYSHHEIHEGDSFTCCYKADITNGASMNILLITPPTTKLSHLTYEIESELESDFDLYEGSVVSNTGTAITIFNRDRNNTTTSTTLVCHTPTLTSSGTALRCWHIGSNRSFGGGDRGIHEFILKSGTNYWISFTNETANNNFMTVKLDWYEHTNKDA